MKSERWKICGLLLLLIVSMCGCVRIEIGDHLTSPTVGRQLMDLNTAFQQGALDLKEFTRARDSLLGR